MVLKSMKMISLITLELTKVVNRMSGSTELYADVSKMFISSWSSILYLSILLISFVLSGTI